MPSFQRLSPACAEVLRQAACRAASGNAARITPAHLLSALAVSDGPAGRALRACGLTPGAHVDRDGAHLPFDPSLNRVLTQSLREALRRGHVGLDPEDLLAAVLAHSDAAVDAMLADAGTSRAVATAVLAAVINASSGEDDDTLRRFVAHLGPLPASTRRGR